MWMVYSNSVRSVHGREEFRPMEEHFPFKALHNVFVGLF